MKNGHTITFAKRVLIMAGGTGGHVFPALALADGLRAKGIEVHWLGTAQGIEARLIPQHSIPFCAIKIGGVRGKSWYMQLLSPLRLVRAILQAMRVIKHIQPQVVVGFGGYASGPGGIAAYVRRLPLMTHEQNAVAGVTNRILRFFATKTYEAFPHAYGRSKVETIGNPVRQSIVDLPSPIKRFAARHPDEPLRLLVLGGSLGAQRINELVVKMLKKCPASMRPVVHHQTGEKHIESVRALYQAAKINNAEIYPFIEDIAQQYAWADLVIARAGALTVSELAAVGVPSLLIPLPIAVDDHQTHNARYLSDSGGAILLPQVDLTEDRLWKQVQRFVVDRAALQAMSEAAYAKRQVDAVSQMVTACLKIMSQEDGF